MSAGVTLGGSGERAGGNAAVPVVAQPDAVSSEVSNSTIRISLCIGHPLGPFGLYVSHLGVVRHFDGTDF